MHSGTSRSFLQFLVMITFVVITCYGAGLEYRWNFTDNRYANNDFQ